jgi:serine protease Do
VLTNLHVVAGARGAPTVIGTDGLGRQARVVATSRPLDLALLALPEDGLPPAPIGDSTRLRVGELVFAVGHPWGQPWSVSAGIVSGLGPRDHVRSDVRLAPGCSGGPLVDARGDVVGINTLVLGGDLAVAVASEAARRWVEEVG